METTVDLPTTVASVVTLPNEPTSIPELRHGSTSRYRTTIAEHRARSPRRNARSSSSCRRSRCTTAGTSRSDDVGLDIAANEITAFIGPSGCGKTTVLRTLNRMHDLTPGAQVGGSVRYHGEDLYGPKVDPAEVRRRIGMVFQKPNPFPKTIFDNVAYGPKLNGRKRSEMHDIVEHALTRAALVGRGEGQAEAQRARPSPAGSSSVCASPERSRSSPTWC